MSGNLLIVSSDRGDISTAECAAEEQSLGTIAARTYREAVAAASKNVIAVIFCEHALHDGDWKDLLSRMVTIPEPPPLVVIAEPSDRPVWADAISLGAYDVIAQPLDKREAAHVISRAVAHDLPSMAGAFAHR